MSHLAQIEKERAERKSALAEARNEQRATDMSRLNELEIEHGDSNVAFVEVDRFSPGLPTIAVVRSLRKSELKRFRDMTRPNGADAAAAADMAADSAWLYPDKGSDEHKALIEAVPGIATRAGVAAVHLAAGMEQAEGK